MANRSVFLASNWTNRSDAAACAAIRKDGHEFVGRDHADTCVLIMPSSRWEHFVAGYLAGKGVSVFALSDGDENYHIGHLPGVTAVRDLPALIAAMA